MIKFDELSMLNVDSLGVFEGNFWEIQGKELFWRTSTRWNNPDNHVGQKLQPYLYANILLYASTG